MGCRWCVKQMKKIEFAASKWHEGVWALHKSVWMCPYGSQAMCEMSVWQNLWRARAQWPFLTGALLCNLSLFPTDSILELVSSSQSRIFCWKEIEAKSHRCSVALSELSTWSQAARQRLLLQGEMIMFPLSGCWYLSYNSVLYCHSGLTASRDVLTCSCGSILW